MAVPITFDQPPNTANLQGRSVLVTGAASGIGLACATKIAESGAYVTISDLQEQAGHELVHDLSSKGYKVQFVVCDVTSYQAQVEMFQKAVEFGNGKIDIVIPSAGIVAEKNLFDMVPEEAPTLHSPSPPEPGFSGANVNLHAVYNTCYLAMHYFRLRRDGADTFKPNIVFVASLAGYVGFPSSSTYSLSKFGIRGLFYGIRDRASRSVPPVRINLVAPWYVDTAMTRKPEFVQSEAGFLLQVMGCAPMERVVDAVVRFSAEESLHGRVAGIFPHVNEDLGDDIVGGYGGIVLQKHMTIVTKEVVKFMAEAEMRGDFLSVFSQYNLLRI
ncbi:NAD(P)-binding protein [Cucurbitaria berberidis CBS 394.84]|uniref:NAD(P)-binding protein n=1 Tax=Cucurbitaria berberidis CBS 394.84 TaxID=1168544 RepID=A0A9P4GLR2_9PLEO|nr:NAD(P)-binding protein [Cucurbitaria berberidis CBS 394.84]KAF1847651.1 NAD(P)-binding protein [Cucurbitaria berberidis CBS 394.84]